MVGLRYIPSSVGYISQANILEVVRPPSDLKDKPTVLSPRPAIAWEDTSWIGNLFVPPPGARMYSLAEIRRILKRHSILFVGDSTSRRLWDMCVKLLNVTDDDVAEDAVTGRRQQQHQQHISTEAAYLEYEYDPYYKGGPYRCPKWDADPVLSKASRHGSFCPDDDDRSRNSFHYLGLECYWMIERLAQQSSDPSGLLWNATQQYSLIVTSAGIWENVRHHDCAAPEEPFPKGVNRSREHLQSLVLSLDQLVLSRSSSRNDGTKNSGHSTKDDARQGLEVIWRTSGYIDNPDNAKVTDELNQLSIDLIENSSLPDGGLAYLDWGSAVHPRSFGNDRIKGNIKAHYGAEARLLMVQMLANALDDRGEASY